MRGQAVQCFVFALVKCIRIYFSGANDTPCLLADLKHHLWIVCGTQQLSSINLSKAMAFMSSKKPVPEAGKVGGLQVLVRLVL